MKKYFSIFLIIFCAGLTAWILYHIKESYQINQIEMSQSDKNSIIEEALNLELSSTTNIISKDADQVSEKAYKKVHDSKYEEAIALIVCGLKKFPQNFNLQSDLAALLGDCSEITSAPLKDKMIQKSKMMFERLMHEVDGQPKDLFYSFKNEYYFRFGMYREQYELGLMRVAEYWGTNEWASKGFQGYYSQGVGAAHYAQKLIEQGDRSLAVDYAQKAIVAWAQYFSYKNDYYNAYVHYALALGILGYKEEMMHALQHSASLIKRDMNYHEFKEVIDFIEKIEQKK